MFQSWSAIVTMRLSCKTQASSLRLIGVYDSPVEGRPPLVRLLSHFQLGTMATLYFISFGFTGVALRERGTPAEEISMGVVAITVALVGAIKTVVLHVYRKKIFEIYRSLGSGKVGQSTKSNRLHHLFLFFMMFSVLAGFVYLVHPLVTSQKCKFLMAFRVPFDVSRPGVYAGSYVLAIFSLYNSAISHLVADSFVVVVASMICDKFEALGNDFRMLGQLEATKQKGFLKKCIIEHNEILRILKDFSKITNYMYFFHVFASAILVCMAAYATLRTDNLHQIGLHITFFLAALMQLFVYCFVGQQITDGAEALHFECYSCSWYRCRSETRQSLAIVLTVTGKPAVLKGCSVVDMSHRMFLKVVTESYSYTMIMLSLIS